MAYVKSLPINDTPEIFGLHDNANITFAQNETFDQLEALLKLQPKAAAGKGRSREEVSYFYYEYPQTFITLFTTVLLILLL